MLKVKNILPINFYPSDIFASPDVIFRSFILEYEWKLVLVCSPCWWSPLSTDSWYTVTFTVGLKSLSSFCQTKLLWILCNSGEGDSLLILITSFGHVMELFHGVLRLKVISHIGELCTKKIRTVLVSEPLYSRQLKKF